MSREMRFGAARILFCPREAIRDEIREGIADENRQSANQPRENGLLPGTAPELRREQREYDGDAEFAEYDIIRRERNHPAAAISPPVDTSRHFFVVRNVHCTQCADHEQSRPAETFAQTQT